MKPRYNLDFKKIVLWVSVETPFFSCLKLHPLPPLLGHLRSNLDRDALRYVENARNPATRQLRLSIQIVTLSHGQLLHLFVKKLFSIFSTQLLLSSQN